MQFRFSVKKRLKGELFSPSFSARSIFCKSRFRSDGDYPRSDKVSGITLTTKDSKRNMMQKVKLFRIVYNPVLHYHYKSIPNIIYNIHISPDHRWY